ncbi:glutathione peroxidase [Motiliproteus sediminis]|uniref:glutathione peroxidase n=1 Tax=Motiliproteus sediminis TaxID=1468178 RepID=UPI001FE979BC|nr:glutathione peroxidase [Motiliproteus sediminis]
MLRIMVLLLAALLARNGVAAECPDSLDHQVRPLAGGEPTHLCEAYAGQVILVVNTASKCGYTYQYGGLEHLYDRYRDRGFVVLGFPSNDFGSQEPGSEAQIQAFCRDTYSVQFPMFQKVHAAEGKAHPLFDRLAQESGRYPRWNFHKYLIGRDGRVVADWRSSTEPEDAEIIAAIEAQL